MGRGREGKGQIIPSSDKIAVDREGKGREGRESE